MNRSFIVAVLTVTMIVMMSTASYALEVPHNFNCDGCHGRHLGTGALNANNGCVVCHSSNGAAARMPIDAGAMSNHFGTYTANQPKTGSKSTHNYLAKAPWDPKSFSQEPTSGALLANTANGNIITNTLLCVRCHSAKLTNTEGAFLRATNTNDAMCLDCHRSRQTTTHTTGSHPVAYRVYSTVYKSNTTAFRKVPLSPNQYNNTAKLGNYFKSGKIVCMTCHAPHNADSSSATLDNWSTANGNAFDDPAKGIKGQLQDSKGELLRTDRFGATADSINVCSSCHKETKNLNHNGNGQNIQCDHCHGAHVDYTGDGSAPNLYLVRRDFSNMSTTKVKLGANVKVIYNTATSLRFKRADGKGICQICHTPTPGVAIHDLADTRKEDCLECHTHSTGFAAAACTSCHGQPPLTNYVGGPNGKASQNYGLDETQTPHAVHADAAYYKYSCKNCHYDGTKQGYHNTGTGTFTDVFIDTTGSVGDQAGLIKNVPGDYNPTTKTCSNVYCHSNGKPRGGTISWKSATTPGWEFGRNKIVNTSSECITCHEYGNTLVTNAHYAHVTSIGLKCNICHSATAGANGGIADRTKHANGTKDVSFVTQPANFAGLFTASFNSTDASCTNSCHGIGTPVWTVQGSAPCGSCHAVPATTGSHTLHFTGTTGPNLGTSQAACSSCHTFAAGNGLHANGQIDVTGCTPCHPGSAVWANPALVTCVSCHVGTASVVGSYTAPLKDLNATVGHGQYALANQCTACHDATSSHIGPAMTKRLLVAGNALCNNCHIPAIMQGMSTARANMLTHSVSINGNVNVFTNYTTANDYRARDCAGCHDTHGTTNYMSVRTVVAGETIRPVTLATLSTALRVTSPNGSGIYNGLCQVCHTKAKYFKRNAAPDLTHNQGKNCLSCHTHKGTGIMFAFQPAVGGCGGCHGYPPVSTTITRLTGTIGTHDNYSSAKFQDYSGGGGAHTVAGHIPKSSVQSEGWTNCNSCHYNTSHNTGGTPAKKPSVNVIVDPQYKFNNTTSITYNGNTCSNVSCHFQPSPNWVTGN